MSINKLRDSNIELFRLVLMALIVVQHFFSHGLNVAGSLLGTASPILSETQTYFAFGILSFMLVAVNAFILISGYYSIKLTAGRIFKLYAFCAFFSLLSYLLQVYLLHTEVISTEKLFSRTFLVFSRTNIWFIRDYVYLMLLSPILNKVEGNKSLILAIISLLLINVWAGFVMGVKEVINGYNLPNFLLLYIIGRYLRNSKNVSWMNLPKLTYLGIYIVICCIAGIINITVANTSIINNTPLAFRIIFGYNNPLLILASIAFFLFFLHIKIQSFFINKWATGCLSIYLFHEGTHLFYDNLRTSYLNDSTLRFSLLFVTCFLTIMIVPLIINRFRIMLTGNIESKISIKLDSAILKISNKINKK